MAGCCLGQLQTVVQSSRRAVRPATRRHPAGPRSNRPATPRCTAGWRRTTRCPDPGSPTTPVPDRYGRCRYPWARTPPIVSGGLSVSSTRAGWPGSVTSANCRWRPTRRRRQRVPTTAAGQRWAVSRWRPAATPPATSRRRRCSSPTSAACRRLLEGGGGPQAKAPISAIRVRVADVGGYSERSAERVRLVAEQIAARTGLDVDITLGSSAAPQTVELPAGSFGRPMLRLTESWSALGVASIITQAVDRKSLVLFVLVLVVCVLFLANAVSAAVRDRRSELAVLSCLGWPVRRIAALILGEVALLGLIAGSALADPRGPARDGARHRRRLAAVGPGRTHRPAALAGRRPGAGAAGRARPPGRRPPPDRRSRRLGTPAAHPLRVGAGQPGPHPRTHVPRRRRAGHRGGRADAGHRRRVGVPGCDRRQSARRRGLAERPRRGHRGRRGHRAARRRCGRGRALPEHPRPGRRAGRPCGRSAGPTPNSAGWSATRGWRWGSSVRRPARRSAWPARVG